VVLERAVALAPMLEQLASDGHLDPERIGRVRDALQELTRQLQ
jgi:hypothetical protein